MDGHNSHIIVNFIANCMKHAINLFISFLYTSHFLQPFNVNMFVPLKHILIKKTNAVFKHDFKHIS